MKSGEPSLPPNGPNQDPQHLGAGLRILLIEDDEDDALWVKSVLQKRKGEFLLQWEGRVASGLEQLKKIPYDLVISDLNLPDGYGLEIYERIVEARPQIPVILLTGNVREESLAIEALQKGAQDYLIKGKVEPEGFIRALRYAIERKRLLLLRDEFVNIVSHELRNPLAVLQESVSQMHEGMLGPVTNDQKYILEMAQRKIRDLRRTTSELLDMAKIESGKLHLKKSVFDMSLLVLEVLDFFKPLATGRKLTLKADLPDKPVMVEGDRQLIEQVYTNLINNALKFTDKGSISLRVKTKDAHVICEVSDTGQGIAPEDLPKAFGKFEQFSAISASEFGSGLGLYICRRIILAHGGTVSVQSTLGEGTTFSFVLPLKLAYF